MVEEESESATLSVDRGFGYGRIVTSRNRNFGFGHLNISTMVTAASVLAPCGPIK